MAPALDGGSSVRRERTGGRTLDWASVAECATFREQSEPTTTAKAIAVPLPPHADDPAGRCRGQRIILLRDEPGKATKRAKLPEGFEPHDLRHRRATTWIADEKNVYHVREALGHSVIPTTTQYKHLPEQDLRPLVDEPAEAATAGR